MAYFRTLFQLHRLYSIEWDRNTLMDGAYMRIWMGIVLVSFPTSALRNNRKPLQTSVTRAGRHYLYTIPVGENV